MKILNNKLYIIIFIFSLIFYKGASSDEIARECFDKGYKLDIHGKYKESIKYYNKAIEFNPDYYEVYYNNAKNFLYLGLYDSTIIYINKYNKIDSEYYLAWYIKGYANIYLNKYGEALKCIDKTIYFINIYYDFFILNYYLSSLLGKTGFVKYFYNNIILINKYNNDVLINKGAILSKLGRYEDALKCFSNV
ncbi:MAG: hypothetical protein QG635_1706, partial [Bacteroidota bacterium]|nr:hypothetical protein [Bacteroidota bacterium]